MCHTLAFKVVAKQLLQLGAEGTEQDPRTSEAVALASLLVTSIMALEDGVALEHVALLCREPWEGQEEGFGVTSLEELRQLSMPGGSSWNLSLILPAPPVCPARILVWSFQSFC